MSMKQTGGEESGRRLLELLRCWARLWAYEVLSVLSALYVPAVPGIGQWKVQSKCKAVGPLHQSLCLSAV